MVLVAADSATSQIPSDIQIQQAIDLGLHYKSRDKLWDREFLANRYHRFQAVHFGHLQVHHDVPAVLTKLWIASPPLGVEKPIRAVEKPIADRAIPRDQLTIYRREDLIRALEQAPLNSSIS